MPALIGRKIGMTRLYDQEGRNVPVTVIAAGPNQVSQVKTAESDRYDAIQLAFEDVKGRNSTIPVIGHDAKAGLTPKRFHREIRVTAEQAEAATPGEKLNVSVFEGLRFVDVIGTSKGKGFAGGMKRWGFKGQGASHGTERKHRSPGSIGGRASNAGTGRPKKGAKMAGQLGNVRVTTRSLEVIAIDTERNLLMVKGAVPGPKQGMVLVRESVRLSKRKATIAKAS
ncbi:MAG: 50S ribosomal protein L3 [Phycisphaeraceae bacterium]|nr:50S ribosomal protein L3 [Phycisphaeraceae bacterium]